MVTFTVYRGDRLVQELDLEGPEITIGRNLASQIVLPDEGKGVSRDHASLRYEGGHYVLYDRNSKIGTLVDGKKIKRVALEPGQEFVIGPYRLVFNVADESSSGLRPTVVLPPPPPPPVSDVPAREGTAKRMASGQTQSKQPTVRTQALGTKVTEAMAWLMRLPPSLLYSTGVVALVLLGAVLYWLSQPSAPSQNAGNTPVTTISTSTTTSIESESIIRQEELVAISDALDAVDATITPADSRQRIDASRYTEAIAAYDQIINDRIQPLLNRNADHPQVRALLDRAQTAATKARGLELRLPDKSAKVTTTIPPPAISDPLGVQRRADESDVAYQERNLRAKADHERAKALGMKGDVLGAHKALVALGEREPSLFEINASIKNALADLQRERQSAVAAADEQNRVGHSALIKKQFAVAVPALTAAWRALNRAVELDERSVSELAANNFENREYAAKAIIELARSYANDERSANQARTHFQWVIALLPASHQLWKEAESSLKRLGS